MYTIEEYDEIKTKILKYILFKKRSKEEVIQKFSRTIDEEMLRDVIEELELNGYIDDEQYIKKTIEEFQNLNNLSIKEIKYKLYSKGISGDLIDKYISEYNDELEEYETKSATNLILKKEKTMEEEDIINYLLKKGYKLENIKKAIRNIKEE